MHLEQNGKFLKRMKHIKLWIKGVGDKKLIECFLGQIFNYKMIVLKKGELTSNLQNQKCLLIK